MKELDEYTMYCMPDGDEEEEEDGEVIPEEEEEGNGL